MLLVSFDGFEARIKTTALHGDTLGFIKHFSGNFFEFVVDFQMDIGQFISSQKGFPQLMAIQDYIYNKERTITMKKGQVRTYWDCNLRERTKCKAHNCRSQYCCY